jgi:hypothetical protein
MMEPEKRIKDNYVKPSYAMQAQTETLIRLLENAVSWPEDAPLTDTKAFAEWYAVWRSGVIATLAVLKAQG